MADDQFFESIRLSIRQVERLYPDATFYLYDWGLTIEQAAEAAARPNVEVVDWSNRLAEFPVVREVDWAAVVADQRRRRGPIARVKEFVAGWLPLDRFESRRQSLDERADERMRFESLVCNTPLCILDCLLRHDGPLVFLDGDALLTSRIDEVFTDDYDVGVTMRRMAELDFSHDRCNVINSGVLFFRGDRERSVAFVQQWLGRIEKTREYIVVQTALVRLIADSAPQIFEGYCRVGTLTSGPTPVRVKSFPCEQYNFIWIEEGVDTAINKIVHFKGGRHLPRTFRRLLQTIDLAP